MATERGVSDERCKRPFVGHSRVRSDDRGGRAARVNIGWTGGISPSASASESSGAVGSKDDQEAVRKVIDTAVDAANLSDPRMLASVLCEPSGPTKSDKLPADAFVNIQDYPAVDGDEVQVDLEIAVPGGESSAGS
jgi:hypothetical protein